MTLSKTGRSSRMKRTTEQHSGSWGTYSQDMVQLAGRLFEQSRVEAQLADGNAAPQALAGIPLLMSALHCFLLELYAGLFTDLRDRPEMLRKLAQAPSDAAFLRGGSLAPSILAELELLTEVRNEIVHPAYRPGRSPDGTPEYLGTLRDRGLLQSTGRDDDYNWMSQLQSHRLFVWAWETIEAVVNHFVETERVMPFWRSGLTASYSRWRRGGAA